MRASQTVPGVILESTLELEAVRLLDQLGACSGAILDSKCFVHRLQAEVEQEWEAVERAEGAARSLSSLRRAEDGFVARLEQHGIRVVFCEDRLKASLDNKLVEAGILAIENVRERALLGRTRSVCSLFDSGQAASFEALTIERITGRNFGKWKGLVVRMEGVGKSLLLTARNEALLQEYRRLAERLLEQLADQNQCIVPGGFH